MKLNELIPNHSLWLKNSNAGVQIDINNIKLLKEQVLSKLLLSSIFEKTEFNDIVFKNCDLTGSSFFNCSFKRCNFSHSLLNKCEFYDCVFEDVIFDNIQLVKSELNNCLLPYSAISDSNLDWSYFNNCDLREVHFKGITLEGAIFVHCKMFNSKKNSMSFGTKYPSKLIDIDFSSEGNNSIVIQKNEFLKRIVWKE